MHWMCVCTIWLLLELHSVAIQWSLIHKITFEDIYFTTINFKSNQTLNRNYYTFWHTFLTIFTTLLHFISKRKFILIYNALGINIGFQKFVTVKLNRIATVYCCCNVKIRLNFTQSAVIIYKLLRLRIL